jgi:hypothetical protein
MTIPKYNPGWMLGLVLVVPPWKNLVLEMICSDLQRFANIATPGETICNGLQTSSRISS